MDVAWLKPHPMGIFDREIMSAAARTPFANGLTTGREPSRASKHRVQVSIEEATMAMPSKPPLKSDDFPLNVEGDEIKGRDGKPIAKAKDSAKAADVAGRLNEDEDRREEDKWSA
jgi:hypothetical protein